MSFTPYTPSDTWRAALSVPDNGEANTSANLFDATAKYNADCGLYLYNRSIAAKGGSFDIPLTGAHINTNSRFTADYGGGATYFQSDVAGVGNIIFPIVVPHIGCEITDVTVRANGLFTAGAHGGDLGTRPEATLVSVLKSTGVDANEDSVYSPTVTSGLYEAMHDMAMTGLSLPLDGTKFYLLAISGEGAANAANDKFAVYGATVTIAPV